MAEPKMPHPAHEHFMLSAQSGLRLTHTWKTTKA